MADQSRACGWKAAGYGTVNKDVNVKIGIGETESKGQGSAPAAKRTQTAKGWASKDNGVGFIPDRLHP